MEIKRCRDLTLIERAGQPNLVIACDSCGGIGEKPQDQIKVPAEVVGYFTARVSLMEVMSVGARVMTVINTLSVEREPTGEKMIKGIQKMIEEVKLPITALNGSTEENVVTCQTAMGITVIGEVERESIKIGCSKPGDLIVALGTPKVGNEIKLPIDDEICSIKDFQALVKMKNVKDIHPIGSKGMYYEAQLLASLNHCEFKSREATGVDLKKSAGPATAVIFSVSKEQLPTVESQLQQQVKVIGSLEN
ncbi:conserved hypothetical protein [Alkaliphilus metalliredigens QYMF]|uniref:PurM-like N-terminal domain-containing protein n=1 Tax=Alkaliphilus metalliredigens (strain QYMF) TaxID=293826 RepID=A6TJE2_ALKMQ|nr:AIR synthase related protein [Alkaliphilus metalliredigens]ABR46310.1 conserved hypothetical protein [Alkaliphilus metalliredigens QYMF]